MDDRQYYDCVVVGSGPGGYVAAIRAAQLGLRTALVEEGTLGGTCLNRGCIPSKVLLANADVLRKVRQADRFGISVHDVAFDYAKMKARKDDIVQKTRRGLEGLIQSNKITIVRGRGRLLSSTEVAVVGQESGILQARTIILATGSEPMQLPILPIDGVHIHDSTSILDITTLPKRLLIVGGGVIGCEFATLHHSFDVDVTIVELLPTILPMEGKQIADTLAASFRKRGIKIETSARVMQATVTDGGVALSLADGRVLEGDMVLVCVGRRYNTQDIGLEKAGVFVEQNGTLPTNDRMQTNVPNVYAIGDITGKWNLAHVASHQGLVAADNAAGHASHIRYNAVPSIIFTHPEIGTVGYSLEKAVEAGFNASVGKFPFQVLGKSQATLETEGFAQIVVDKKSGLILGAQVVGSGAATLIAEMGVAIANELTIHSISETIHAHPTTAEAWLEAAFLAQERPLHLPPSLGKK